MEALKNYWYSMTDTKGIDSLTVKLSEDGSYILSWLNNAGEVTASDSYTMTGKIAKGLEGAVMYVFTADTLDETSGCKYFVTMDPGMEGDSTAPIAAHYHFQFGSSLNDLLKNGERYNGTENNMKDSKWYATMIDEEASALSKYNVILGMHRADKWSKLPSSGSSGGGSGSGGSSSSSGSTTSTVTNSDGSKTTTVTDNKTGTETKTTKYEDGSTLVVETLKNGTETTTEVRADGVTIKTVNEPDKEITASITIPQSVGSTTVLIPVKTGYGTAAVNSKTGEIIRLAIPSDQGMSVKLDRSAELILKENSKKFTDIDSHWAANAIEFVTARELFSGTGSSTFSADDTMTRAMLMTVLARFDGEDISGGSVWYEKAMNWAVKNGISDGSDPDGMITREQLAVMLYHYAGSPATSGSLSKFSDAGAVSSYAGEAMCWAVEAGLISGTGESTLEPQGDATRAQVAVILMHFCEYMAK